MDLKCAKMSIKKLFTAMICLFIDIFIDCFSISIERMCIDKIIIIIVIIIIIIIIIIIVISYYCCFCFVFWGLF